MSYYRTCAECGTNLDRGEICDCLGATYAENLRQEAIALVLRMNERQLKEAKKILNEETAQSVTSTPDGKVEQICEPVSVSILSANAGGVKYAEG